MKLNGVFGMGTGKVGNSVWAVSGGVQIVRPYNPNVSNPNTDAQVEQRAKLKLMSQLAAALAPIIAFKKLGLVSARNQFISANIGLCEYANGKVEVGINMLDLTGSRAPLPNITTNPGTGGGVIASLSSAASADVDAVLYAIVHETIDNLLEIVDFKVATTPGDGRTFAAEMLSAADPACVYAYGIKYTDEASRKRYANYVADIGADGATLDVVSRELLSGASFTRTQYNQL